MAITTTIPTNLDFPNRGVLERDAFVLAQETAQDLLAGAYTTALNQYAVELNATQTDINTKAEQVANQAIDGGYSQAYINATFTPKILNTQTDKATPVDADLIPLSDSASSFVLKKLSWANIKATLISSFGVLISGLTAKTTPADADMIVIADSASSNASKKLTWANIKAALKTYFDTLYMALTGNQTIDGVKTFSTSPIVPTPTTDTQVVNKKYVDDAINTGTKGAYGLSWNQETDVYTILGATDRTQIQRNMKRCVLKDDGTVNYYLDPYNSTLKADGTPAVLTGADGNVMVEVPKFWYKHELNGNEHQWWVSDKPLIGYSVHPWFLEGGVEIEFRYYRAYTCTNVSGTLRSISGSTPTRSQTRNTFRTQARANGTGWGLASWNGLNAIQLLFITEFGTFNTQAILGRGNDTGSDYGITTGQSNVIGNASSGALNNDMWMSYRGIENWYGDCWEFIDGINISNYVVYLSNTPSSFADDTYTGSYSNSGITLPAMNASYIKKISGNFIPTAVGGSSSTFITDGGWSGAGGKLVIFGGSAAGHVLLDGGFAFYGHDFASNAVDFAAGLTR